MSGTNFFPDDGTIKVGLTDSDGNAILIECTVANIPSGVAGYAVGCELVATDSGAHYYNTGSATSCTFAVGGTVTAGSIGTTQLANGGVTLAKLAAGITPSHVVKFAGKHTTTGGSATEAFTVSGVASTDIVFTMLQTAGGTARTILTAAPTTNTITLVFSGDPSTDHIVSYQVLRAAS